MCRLPGRAAGPLTVFDMRSLEELDGAPIVCDNHCFGCTAGSGSGCQGAPEAADAVAAARKARSTFSRGVRSSDMHGVCALEAELVW